MRRRLAIRLLQWLLDRERLALADAEYDLGLIVWRPREYLRLRPSEETRLLRQNARTAQRLKARIAKAERRIADWTAVLAKAGMLVAVVVLSLTACAAPVDSTSTRPGCADRVAKALVSPKVVPASYQCFTAEEMSRLSGQGVNSDDQLAAVVAAGPHVDTLTYESQLKDGGYLYRVASGSNLVDLILWLNTYGSVEAFAFVGRNL
jgi:hypothetical protein